MNDQNDDIGRFDQVMLLTTQNVSFLSAPPGTKLSPKGVWSVTAVVGNNDLLLVKNKTTIKIPHVDVKIIAKHDLTKIDDIMKGLLHGKKRSPKKRDT
jgi:hypothetical protein|tara:strand:+ start:1405 stop:1698 length:294 start_codon:yes stop_codon:yes gene_type:complete